MPELKEHKITISPAQKVTDGFFNDSAKLMRNIENLDTKDMSILNTSVLAVAVMKILDYNQLITDTLKDDLKQARTDLEMSRLQNRADAHIYAITLYNYISISCRHHINILLKICLNTP